MIKMFIEKFGEKPSYKIKSSGRIEIIGNHTDHNHGLCMAGTCNLCIYGYLSAREDNKITYFSKGFDSISLDLNDLTKKEEEEFTSAALIRGVANYFVEHGYKVGGFNAATDSSIFPGAGVSSSAAYESLIAQIFNVLYNEGKVSHLFMAKAGQYAEYHYFGKKCGLLDQIGTGFGNISYIDFKDIDNPIVETVEYPFDDLHFVLVNTGGSHAHLSHLYSAIPEDMWSAAHKLGHNYLRDCEKHDDESLSDVERSRAKHFFDENERVLSLKEAFISKDKNAFLNAINGSRYSSTNYLKNMMVEGEYIGSPLEACDLAMEILKDEGACRINGGGFAGSIICIVPTSLLDEFKKKMSLKYKKENVVEVSIDSVGPIVERM